jgi:peptidoglycan/xylan/chitin deacetylase (PgdA/CDA1 family)
MALQTIAEKDYRTVSLSQILECLSRDAPFPENTLVITFDDGYESTYREAFPVLTKYGMTATVFLITGDQTQNRGYGRLPASGGRKMLTWEHIHEMKRSGIEFGSHSLTHPDLTRLSVEEIDRELRESKSQLEDILECEIASFAYPYGYHTPAVRKIVKKHYSLACCGRLGAVKRTSDLFALERVDMYYFRTAKLARLLSSRLFPLYIHFRNGPRQLRSLLRKGRFL